MAGSFDIFRKYQRSLLVFVAILAMLAFFVLPPFLQMGGGGAPSDPVAVSWTDGSLREGDLERAVAMRTVVNRFLVESAAAAGRDPAQLPLFPETEQQVVRAMLLAKEAAANGIVVSDAAINDFLAEWTNNLVRPDQFAGIIAGLRLGPMAVSQHDLFSALRTELAARNMLILFQTGFSGDPPGWRWDYFKRLEQRATVEAVPIVVESVAADVPEPSAEQLRAFFDRYKDDLPQARSPEPGFREPHRVKYEYLVAKRDVFLDKAKKEVTDAQIAEFYDKNKATMFRERPKPEPKAAATPESAAEAKEGDANAEKEAEGKGEKPDEKTEAKPAPAADKDKQGAAPPRHPFRPVAFKQPTTEKPAEKTAEKPAEKKEDKPAEEPKYEPLENVKEEIRQQLAAEQANRAIDAIFTAVAADLTAYAEDFALWQARQEKGGAPKPPDFKKIAEVQGVEAGASDLVTADEAVASGDIGRSFEFVPDPNSRFGFRQRNWLEQIYGQGAPSLRPVTSRDVAGNRYLSWKTEDKPEFTPSFETARPGVERAWKIVEGRALARKKAEALVAEAAAKKQSLEATVAGQDGVKATKVGPFSWLSQGTVPQGTSPFVSDPDGLVMAGEDLMRAVFAVEPEQGTTAFNEPQTICYALRVVSLEPPEAELREKFLAAKNDQQRIATVAQSAFSEAFGDWLKQLETKHGLQWKRQPR